MTTVRAHPRNRTPVQGAEHMGWRDATEYGEPRSGNPYGSTRFAGTFARAAWRAWYRGWDRAHRELTERKAAGEAVYLPERDDDTVVEWPPKS